MTTDFRFEETIRFPRASVTVGRWPNTIYAAAAASEIDRLTNVSEASDVSDDDADERSAIGRESDDEDSIGPDYTDTASDASESSDGYSESDPEVVSLASELIWSVDVLRRAVSFLRVLPMGMYLLWQICDGRTVPLVGPAVPVAWSADAIVFLFFALAVVFWLAPAVYRQNGNGDASWPVLMAAYTLFVIATSADFWHLRHEYMTMPRRFLLLTGLASIFWL